MPIYLSHTHVRTHSLNLQGPDVRLLYLQIIDATFQTNQPDFSAFIEIRNIATGQVEQTKTVEAAAPHYDDAFVFKTKQNANNMIMMKARAPPLSRTHKRPHARTFTLFRARARTHVCTSTK